MNKNQNWKAFIFNIREYFLKISISIRFNPFSFAEILNILNIEYSK